MRDMSEPIDIRVRSEDYDNVFVVVFRQEGRVVEMKFARDEWRQWLDFMHEQRVDFLAALPRRRWWQR